MRLIVLPLTNKRRLLYCAKAIATSKDTQSLSDRAINRAAAFWTSWVVTNERQSLTLKEQKEKGWQKTVTKYGNKLLDRIPYEEWSLKSLPSLPSGNEAEKSRKASATHASTYSQVAVLFPASIIPQTSIPSIISVLIARRDFHKYVHD